MEVWFNKYKGGKLKCLRCLEEVLIKDKFCSLQQLMIFFYKVSGIKKNLWQGTKCHNVDFENLAKFTRNSSKHSSFCPTSWAFLPAPRSQEDFGLSCPRPGGALGHGGSGTPSPGPHPLGEMTVVGVTSPTVQLHLLASARGGQHHSLPFPALPHAKEMYKAQSWHLPIFVF